MNIIQTVTPGTSLSQEVVVINNTINGAVNSPTNATPANILTTTATATPLTTTPQQTNIQINIDDRALPQLSHPGLPSLTIRSALMGAVALEPPPPAIVPRTESLPTPVTTASNATDASTKMMESFQETYKNLTTQLMQMFDKVKGLVTDLTLAKSGAQSSASIGSQNGPQTIQAGTRLKSGGGFEWKPQSSRDGKLSVAVPNGFRNAKEVRIVSADYGKVIATGVNARPGNNPSDIFRFDQVGGNYPAGSILQIIDSSGKIHEVKINDPAHGYRY